MSLPGLSINADWVIAINPTANILYTATAGSWKT